MRAFDWMPEQQDWFYFLASNQNPEPIIATPGLVHLKIP